jgi:DegV family protein with EDD domain
MAVKVFTDSACDLAEAVCADLDIGVVPLSVRFGNEELTDRVDLSPEAFYEKMASTPTLPETAAPSPGAFEQAFRGALEGGADGVVCINLAGGLSATIQSAQNAAKAIGDERIRIVDSHSVSWGLGSVVVACAEKAKAGGSLEEVVALAEDMIPRTRVFATLDTLDNLKNGGRIGGAQALLGTLLSVKPMIEVGDQVHEAGKPRTRGKALRQLAEKVRDAGKVENLSVMHGLAPDVDEFVALLAGIVPEQEIGVQLIGATIGVHGGPRVMGVAFQVF